jgi:hypothetical protein
MAATARDHVRQEQPGEVSQRSDVHVQHAACLVPVGEMERAIVAEPGVVHQNIDGDPARLEVATDFFRSPAIRQIFYKNLNMTSEGFFSAPGGLEESRLGTGDENQIAAVFCKNA